MIPDELFEECQTILQDSNILEEDQTERIQSLIESKTSLRGKALDNETLDVLWRHREKTTPASSSPPVRSNHTIVRRASPAPWQYPRVTTPTPSLGSTPPTGLQGFASPFKQSPFPSPRPSPRIAYAAPFIPHSPSLSTYEPIPVQDSNISVDSYGDYGNDTVSWLVNEENSLAAENMSPHDMLRSVLGEGRTDAEIDQALEICGYDLGSTLSMLIDQHMQLNDAAGLTAEKATVIGKSTTPNPERSRPITPRNGVVCRFFLSTGQCLRADCRFSHDLGTTICKYWLMGSCLAGDTCIFSHDPTMSVSKMTLDSQSRTSTPPPQVQVQDQFPSLSPEQWSGSGSGGSGNIAPPPGFKLSHSRPISRQHSRDREQSPARLPSVDDADAFPTLGSIKSNSHGKKRDRRHKNDIPTGPSSLAEVVRMTPSPGPTSNRNSTSSSSSNRWSGGSPSSKRSSRIAASHIPPPQQIPWLETGSALNRIYLKHRKEATSHGMLRAKYLQLASTAWQRHDSKAAKEHSRKANNENLLMNKAHKEASKAIYEERNKEVANGAELYIDLHGLLPDEGVKYLEDILLQHKASSRPIYAIVGTGHHSKNGRDKVARAVRLFLDEWRYAYREFSVNGDRNFMGGILGIDPSLFDKDGLEGGSDGRPTTSGSTTGRKDPPKGPGRKKA